MFKIKKYKVWNVAEDRRQRVNAEIREENEAI